MGRRGPQPKPVEVKRRLGNPGKRPLPKPLTTIAPIVVITRPDQYPSSGSELTQALLAAGAAAWIGTTDQLATLRLVEEGWDTRTRWREDLAREGEIVEWRGRLMANPRVAMIRDLEKQLTTWLSQLGLNPADRGRLGLAEVKAQSKLGELRDRRKAYLAGRPAG